jgi:Reverse transcriptase (RNA-dependent DNA polymerase)
MIVVRYADDTVLGFEHEADARRCLADLRKRAEAFALSLHPDKTRVIRFGRYAALNRKERGLGKPETFNFLGYVFSAVMWWRASELQAECRDASVERNISFWSRVSVTATSRTR